MLTRLVKACRLCIYLGNADQHRHRALAGEILHRAHRAGLAGATSVQGIQGFGRNKAIHSAPRWGVVDRTPVMLQIIDSPERLRAFLLHLDDLAGHLLIVCDVVEVMAPPDDTA